MVTLMVYGPSPVLAEKTVVTVGDSSGDQLRHDAQDALENHPHFRGRSNWVRCECHLGTLRLCGRVPSYYLKQLAQEVVRKVPQVAGIENQIVVANPCGEIGCDACGESEASQLERLSDAKQSGSTSNHFQISKPK